MQNKISFYVILAVEILTVVLTSIGIFPREAVLILTGLLIFYFIFSKVEDSLIFFIISIPLFIALPISENFDSMANWRGLLAILFLVWLFKKIPFKKIIKERMFSAVSQNIIPKSRLAILVVLFLIIGILSLFVATDIIVGIKKLLFLINIFLLFVIIKDIAKDEAMRLKIIKAGVIAGTISLVVGYSQLIFVFLKPLYTFWQWWAKNVISVFYGSNLSELLAKSNTWFSYYPDSPPTLRMFSVFPDSHSFALFIIITLIFFSYLWILPKSFRFLRPAQRAELRDSALALSPAATTMPARARNPLKDLGKILLWVAVILSFLALVFSGSRGVWFSAVIPFLSVIILFFFRKKIKNYDDFVPLVKSFILILLIFTLSFPASSLIMSKTYQGSGDSTLAFKRAKTITDLEELSVKSRMGIWKASFKSVLKHSLLGVGIGNYPVVLDEDISAGKKGASAHNLYLDVASEMGLLGLIALLLIFFEILKACWKFFKENKYVQVFAFFFVWILIYNLFDVVLLNDKVLLLFMVVLGILYSGITYDRK